MQHNSLRVSHIAKSVSAGALATLLLASGAAADVVTSTWTAGGDGTHWTDAANWSSNPFYPQDGSPAGTGYVARIDRDTGSPYTVLLDTSLSIDGLTLNSPSATLQHTAGTLSLNGTLDVQGGNYQLAGGTIVGGTITGAGTGSAAGNGTLQNVTLDIPFTTNGLTANNVTLNGTSIFLRGGQLTGTVLGSGEIVPDGGFSQVTGGFVVNPGITVRTGTGPGNCNISGPINKGTISAQTPQYTVTFNSLDNTQGTVRASNGGTIRVLGSMSTAKLGNLVNDDGGTIELQATVDNTGQTLHFGGNKGNWVFSGQVTNGTVDLTGATIGSSTRSPVLDNVKLAADIPVTQGGAGRSGLSIFDDIDGAGHTINVGNPGSTARLDLYLDVVPMTVRNTKVSLSNAVLLMAAEAHVAATLDPLTTVSGSGAIQQAFKDFGSYDNQGRIVANVKNQTLTVQPATIFNHGTMAATDGGVLSIALSPSAPWTNNGILAAGAGSQVSVAQNLTMADGSALDVAFDATGAFGLLQVNGNLDLSHVESLDLDVPPGTPAGTYSIVTYTGTLAGAFDQVTPGYAVDYSTPGQIRVTVPEPAGGCLAVLAGVGLLSRRRRNCRTTN